MKKTFIQLGIAIGLAWGLSACNSANQPSDMAETKTDQNEAAKDANEDKFKNEAEDDAKFITQVAEINYAEIKLGELAQSKGMNPSVKKLGEEMVTAHSKANTELMALAQKKGVTFPTGPSNESIEEYNKMNDLSGSDFDKKYTDKMVSGHKDAIDKFEKGAKDCADPELKQWAANMLPSLHKHLEVSQQSKELADAQK